MVARRPLCLVSGLVSELPSGDVASAGSTSIEFVAGTGLYGGGYLSQIPQYGVKVAPQPSGVIFVGNNLALDGTALATATRAASSGFSAASIASSALASGNAALSNSVQALNSGTKALELVVPQANAGSRFTFKAATTIPAGVPVGLNNAAQIEPIRASHWCVPIISGIYVPSGVGGSGVIASGTQFWVQPTGVITPATQQIRVANYMYNVGYDVKYCTKYDDFIITQGTYPQLQQSVQILKPAAGGYLFTGNQSVRPLGDSNYYLTARLDECLDINRYLHGGLYSSNSYPYVQDFGRDSNNLFLSGAGAVPASEAAGYFDLCYLSSRVYIVAFVNSSSVLKARAGYIHEYSTPGHNSQFLAEQISVASVSQISIVKHKDPNKAVLFYTGPDSKTYAVLLTVDLSTLKLQQSLSVPILSTTTVAMQAKYIDADDSYALIATVSSKVNLYKIKETSPGAFSIVSTRLVGDFYGYNSSIDYDPTSRTVGFMTNDYYTSFVAGYTQPSGNNFTPVQSGRLNLDLYNGNCRTQFHRGTAQLYSFHYGYYSTSNVCTPIAPPLADFPALPHANKYSNFVGIANNSVTSGQDCTVILPGEVYTQSSGSLIPGQPIYLDIINSGVTHNPFRPASWSGQVDWNSIGVAVSASGYVLRNLL